MKKRTIGQRLTLGFGAIGAAALVIGLTSLKLTHDLEQRLDRAINGTGREQVLAGQLSTAAADMISAERAIAFSTVLQQPEKTQAAKQQFSAAEGSGRGALQGLETSATDASLRRRIEELDRSLSEAGRHHTEMLRLLDTQQMDAALRHFDEQTLPRLSRLGAASKRLAEEASAQLSTLNADAARLSAFSLWLTLLLLAAAAAVAAAVVVMVRRSTRALRRLTSQMAKSAVSVAGAAGEISTTSQALAQGAAKQAGSLEETSSSSQEMSSMTQRNAENAASVTSLMCEVDRKVNEANRTLDQMVASMGEISASSEKIARIIKVIDEISFQTNILALNAAVEAARAGEAGMGFAVVADEVRNLAQRCAQAARDTAGLIEESIRTSTDGSSKLENMAAAIRSITGSAAEVKRLVEEVNLGSHEQARGMDHVAKTLAEMEQVTQQVAASADESASAAASMSAQAHVMQQAVEALVEIVGSEAAPR